MKNCSHCESSGEHGHEEHARQKVHASSWTPYALLGMAGILLVMGVLQAVQIGAMETPAGVALGASFAPAATGETYEQMMARMHPELYQNNPAPTASSAQGARMVGGC